MYRDWSLIVPRTPYGGMGGYGGIPTNLSEVKRYPLKLPGEKGCQMIILKDCTDEHDWKFLVCPVYVDDNCKLVVEGNSLYIEDSLVAAEQRASQLNKYARDVLGRRVSYCNIYVQVSEDGGTELSGSNLAQWPR